MSSESERDEEEREWDEIASQAAMVAKNEGKLPGALDELLSQWHHSELPWSDYLAEFCDSACDDDYSWHPGDRRQVHEGLYLPDVDGEALPPFVLMLDVSGSIFSEQELLQRFWNELRTIVEELQPERVTVLQFDARVQRVDEYEAHELPETLSVNGGGGTDFVPPFEWLAQQDEQPPFVLVFTDMLCSSYPRDPGVPVLWCNFERELLTSWSSFARPAFGERLDLVELTKERSAA